VVSRDRNLPVEVVNSVGMRFRLIPNGSFIMGSPETEPGHFKGEKQHVAHIVEPFYISETEVTQAQWNAVMGPDSNPSGFKGGRRPVEEVDWHDCQRFLAALAEQEGVPRWTYRLPTEKQWEYSARAGTDTPFYFGTDIRKLRLYEWYKVNSFGRSHKVAQLRPNAYGLYDMLGNVWEWCWDTYKVYPESPEKLDPTKDWTKIRVIRGGNWYVDADACRVAARTRLGVTSKGNMLGFRVVRRIYELNETPPDGDPPPTPGGPVPRHTPPN
jgi:formylglycine-generating enzyme required for sulfatase activity